MVIKAQLVGIGKKEAIYVTGEDAEGAGVLCYQQALLQKARV